MDFIDNRTEPIQTVRIYRIDIYTTQICHRVSDIYIWRKVSPSFMAGHGVHGLVLLHRRMVMGVLNSWCIENWRWTVRCRSCLGLIPGVWQKIEEPTMQDGTGPGHYICFLLIQYRTGLMFYCCRRTSIKKRNFYYNYK